MNELHQKATAFIETSSFFQAMRALGEVVFTGSYALDTMTWPDIDVQLTLSPTNTPFQALSQLSETLLQDSTTIRFKFLNFKNFPKDCWPKALCITANISDPPLKNSHPLHPYWKVDFWILDEKDFEENRQFMTELKEKMTAAHKKLIMNYKEAWTKQWGRSPPRASFFLYHAVVFEGLQNEEDILKYLRDHGVKI